MLNLDSRIPDPPLKLLEVLENLCIVDKFKIAFLLFPLPTEGYFKGEDYIEKAKIKFLSAYKEQNILINVK